jgi:hypothetical protein
MKLMIKRIIYIKEMTKEVVIKKVSLLKSIKFKIEKAKIGIEKIEKETIKGLNSKTSFILNNLSLEFVEKVLILLKRIRILIIKYITKIAKCKSIKIAKLSISK